MVTATAGGASLKKAISLYSPLIDYSAPLLQQTPDTSSGATSQLTLQQQQQLLTQVRHHRSAGANQSSSQQTPSATATTSSSTVAAAPNHLAGGHHHQNNSTSSTATASTECSNNFMNSVVHELNAIKLISNTSASGVGQGQVRVNNNCRPSNVDGNLLFSGVCVGDSNNSISILSNNSCNKPQNNLWGQLSSANGGTNTTNTNTILYNQAATNISNLWGCSLSSSSSSVLSNNINEQANNNNPASTHPSLSPSSSSSVRSSQYHSASSHRSNSKESLWTSSQSSPNSNLRDSFYSIKSNASPTSSTTSSAGSTCSSNGGSGVGGGTGNGNCNASLLSQSTNLWESPLVGGGQSTKLSMDAAASSYANQLNKISNLWEIPNPATNVTNICNPKPQQQQQQRTAINLNSSFLGQSRGDLLFNDLWSNTDGCSTTLNSSDHHQQQQQQQQNSYVAGVGSENKLQSDTIGSIWRTSAPPMSNGQQHHQQQQVLVTRNKSTGPSTAGTIKQQQRPVMGANASFFTNATDAATAASLSSSTVASTAATASSGSSSCMQLFSEDFLNYLNMIN